MSAYSCLRTNNEVHTRWLGVEADAARWGSDAAREAVVRICREAALRCQRTIAMYGSVDILNEMSGINRSRE